MNTQRHRLLTIRFCNPRMYVSDSATGGSLYDCKRLLKQRRLW